MRSSQSSSRGRKRGSGSTPNTRNSRPYDRNFGQHLVDSGIYLHGYRYPDGRTPGKPDNWDEINERLARPRPSLSPSQFSEKAYEQFAQTDADAAKEKQVSETVIPFIEGNTTGDTKCRSGGIPFMNLEHLTKAALVPGNPDIFIGARPEQLEWQVRSELSGSIVPSTQRDLPILPNFFLEIKGPDGSFAVAGRQACYHGALGARGMQALQQYRAADQPAYDNKACTITSIYHGGVLRIYTIHPTSSPEERPEYHMTQLRSFAMTDTVDTFRQGATAYRNLRDWAKEQREEAIRQANELLTFDHRVPVKRAGRQREQSRRWRQMQSRQRQQRQGTGETNAQQSCEPLATSLSQTSETEIQDSHG
jgi:hypothetical protein